MACFNPRPRTGGDIRVEDLVTDSSGFQSTPPHGGRPCAARELVEATGFNPRPRTGGDRTQSHDGVTFTRVVSIHAPARGATMWVIAPADGARFQSTPPHGGRRICGGLRRPRATFQSTPPHGGRQVVEGGLDRAREVSIHAPARGATRRHGHVWMTGGFQSTPPHGGRRRRRSIRFRDRQSFNPRPRTGGDQYKPFKKAVKSLVSIHAPARGATVPHRWHSYPTRRFNPRPRTGGDRAAVLEALAVFARFNPRPRTGGDGFCLGHPARHRQFQSTPPHGGRPG